MEEIKMKCPICGAEVSKVKDVPEEIKRQNPTCENEFYVHWHSILYRIINPKTLWS